MTQRLTLALILAAALAAAPAMAQRSVSGTIGGRHVAASTAATAAPPPATPAIAPASAAADAPAAPAPAATASPAPAGPLAMTIPTPQASAASAGGGLLQTTLALMFVLALLVGLAWFLKRYGPRNFGGGNSNVKLVGALSVGTRERILVVEVGEQWIVVGASPGRMNALATMPRQESSEAATAAALPTANFAVWFKQTIDKRNGK